MFLQFIRSFYAGCVAGSTTLLSATNMYSSARLFESSSETNMGNLFEYTVQGMVIIPSCISKSFLLSMIFPVTYYDMWSCHRQGKYYKQHLVFMYDTTQEYRLLKYGIQM